MSGLYVSAEDSALLRKALKRYSGGLALEIGAGNGGGLLALSGRFETVVGTDIAPPHMSDWRGAGADYLLADAASCVRERSFDLVAFNPPYLKEETGDPATEGGRSLEVPLRFLRDALRVVGDGGRVVMLLNGDAEIGPFEAECAMRGFGLVKVDSEHLFFEELSVYEASASGRRDGGGPRDGAEGLR
jgi:release factor glutamine methyltransferase